MQELMKKMIGACLGLAVVCCLYLVALNPPQSGLALPGLGLWSGPGSQAFEVIRSAYMAAEGGRFEEADACFLYQPVLPDTSKVLPLAPSRLTKDEVMAAFWQKTFAPGRIREIRYEEAKMGSTGQRGMVLFTIVRDQGADTTSAHSVVRQNGAWQIEIDEMETDPVMLYRACRGS